MNQLMSNKNGFQFLPLTTSGSIVEGFISYVYEDAMFLSDKPTHVTWDDYFPPSQSMIVSNGWGRFEDLYMDYIVNGYPCEHSEEVDEAFKAGLTDEDVIESWREVKDFSGSFNVESYTNYVLEMQLIDDIHKALRVFHLCYFEDTSPNKLEYHDEVELTNLINSPVVEVW